MKMMHRNFDHAKRIVAILAIAVVALGLVGCSGKDKAEAQAIAKEAVTSSQALSAYYDEALEKHDASRVGLAFYLSGEVDPDDKGFKKLRKALKARVDVAHALEDLSTELGKIVDFDPDGAKASVQKLVGSIETLNSGHPLDWPRVTVAGQGIDPTSYGYSAQRILDKAVIALVEAQKEREFRKVLPKVGAAVVAILEFLDNDRLYLSEVVADSYSYDFLNSERIVNGGLAIDLKMMEGATKNFDLVVVQESLGILPDTPVPGEALRQAVVAKMQNRLHELVRNYIDNGGRVSGSLFNLYVKIATKTHTPIAVLPTKTNVIGLHLMKRLADIRKALEDDPKARVKDPANYEDYELYVLQSIAMRLTPAEIKAIKDDSLKNPEQVLVSAESDVILGGALVDLAMTKKFMDPKLERVKEDVERANVSFQYIGREKSGTRKRESGPIEPAGLALATLNKTLMDKVLKDAPGNPR